MVIGGYADRVVVTRFSIGELDNLKFAQFAVSQTNAIEYATTTDWDYFREIDGERICKLRRDEVSDVEDQDTLSAMFEYFK